jgi:hypothetical protein
MDELRAVCFYSTPAFVLKGGQGYEYAAAAVVTVMIVVSSPTAFVQLLQ